MQPPTQTPTHSLAHPPAVHAVEARVLVAVDRGAELGLRVAGVVRGARRAGRWDTVGLWGVSQTAIRVWVSFWANHTTIEYFFCVIKKYSWLPGTCRQSSRGPCCCREVQ